MDEIKTLRELEALLGVSLMRYYPEQTISHSGIMLGRVGDNLAKVVATGDSLAIEDACRLISKDPKLPFGKLIKSNLARALRKAAKYVPEADRTRIVQRTASILSLEYCPREAEDYCKLVKHLGAAEARAVVETANPHDEKSIFLISQLAASYS